MLQEFSFPTVMYGTEVLLCAFVRRLTSHAEGHLQPAFLECKGLSRNNIANGRRGARFSEGPHARRVGGARMRPPATSGWEALRGAGPLACDDAFWRQQPA